MLYWASLLPLLDSNQGPFAYQRTGSTMSLKLFLDLVLGTWCFAHQLFLFLRHYPLINY